MSNDEPREPSQFGLFLLGAISRAGFTNTSQFAKSAGLSPSVVFRWIYGLTDPSLPGLAHAAAALGVSLIELAARAYPYVVAEPPPDTAASRLAAELALMLDPASPLSPDDREVIETILDRFLEPYRQKLRESRADG